MIYALTGTVMEKTTSEVVITCGGVGYLVAVTPKTSGALPPPGGEATVYTHMSVSENDVSLYGFCEAAERRIFLMLIAVSGVGPKVALAILSALSPQQIVLAVSAGDHKAFTAASGVGPKLGQRLVLELRDKVAKDMDLGAMSGMGVAVEAVAAAQGAAGQAVAALVGLGYSQSEAARAVAAVDPTLPTAEMIRLALQGIGAQK